MTKQTIIILIIVCLLLLLQLLPVTRSNPPVAAEIQAPADVQTFLQRACYDCHSNQTKWPWYSYVAPVSWFIIHDVEEGREHLNFSEWESYPESKQHNTMEDILDEVTAGDMPLWEYRILHPEAKLENTELELLKQWINSILIINKTDQGQ